jgi:hypothetical protein
MVRKIQDNTVSELALKYGSISIRTLRDFYGSFAPHCADDSKLSEVLADLDVASFTQVTRDYKNGRLAQVCQSGPKGESHGRASDNGNEVL